MVDVVILLSDKRSGSTMFQDELCKHSQIQTVPYSPHSNLETHWWLMGAVLLDMPAQLYLGAKKYPGYGGVKNARIQMIDLLAKCAPGYVPPTDDRELIFEGWETLCKELGKPVFFEKSPQFLAHWAALSLMLEWMERTELKVKVVGLVRNPHGVLYSAAKLFGVEPEVRQIGWLETCRNLTSFSRLIPPENYRLYRYEDLAANPSQGFAEICEFIGVVPETAVGEGTHSSSSEKWRKDEAYTLGLSNSVVQMARSFGYSDASLYNENATPQPITSENVKRKSLRLWYNLARDRFVRPIMMRFRATLSAFR